MDDHFVSEVMGSCSDDAMGSFSVEVGEMGSYIAA